MDRCVLIELPITASRPQGPEAETLRGFRLVAAFTLAFVESADQVDFRVPTNDLAAGGYLLSVEFDGPSVWKRFVKLP